MKLLTSLLALLFVSSFARAQEVQVPFDSAGTIMVIDQETEHKLDLFASYPHFLEARLYREPDSSYVIEVTSFEKSQLVKDRLPKTPSAVESMREDIDVRLGRRPAAITLAQSSRTKFVVWETLISFLGYGPAISSAISSDNTGVATGLEFILGGAGYILSSALTAHAPMTDGEGSLALGGAFLGAVHGVLVDELISNGNSGSEIGPLATLFSIGETGIGYAIASHNAMSEGTADIIRYGGLFGMADGIGLAFAFNPDATPSLWAGMGLVGSTAGFAAGIAMADAEPYTRGNATAVLTAGGYGALLPPLIYASATSYNTDANLAAPTMLLLAVAGNVGGTLLGNALMDGRHLSNWEGIAVLLGTTAGSLIGEGVGLVFASNTNALSPWAVTLPIVLGSAAGFGISIASIGNGSGDKSSTGWNFEANPGALMGALVPQHTSNTLFVPPFFSASYSF